MNAKLLLQESKAHYEQQVRELHAARFAESESAQIQELSSYDNESADLGEETFQREKALGELLHMKHTLGLIDEALQRLAEGTYGVCVACHRPVAQERLAVQPWAARCVPCQELWEQQPHPRRPIEEELLNPPFKRTFLDDTGNVGVDGEDVWQAVAEYGNANSPQDVPPAVEQSAVMADSEENQGNWEFGMHEIAPLAKRNKPRP